MNMIPVPRDLPRGIKLHIVEDDPVVVRTLTSVVERVVAEVQIHTSAEEFLSRYDRSDGCALLLDVELPGMDGIQLLERLGDERAMLPTVVMSADPNVCRVVSAMQHGAIDFLPKPLDPTLLVQRLEHLAAKVPAAAQLRRLRLSRQTQLATLTPREREVFDLMVRGASAKQIGGLLGMQLRTAHIHRTNVLRKFDVDTAVDLAHIATLLGLGSGTLHDGFTNCVS